MNIFWVAVLGILQGFTEFLPVSSSGHLVIVQEFIPGFTQPGVLFDVVLHAGTLFAILYFYRKIIIKLRVNHLLLILIASVPAALFGFLFQPAVEGLFTNIRIVGLALIVTGILNLLTDKVTSKKRKVTPERAFLIGVAQAVSIIPGISRSGTTIFAGTALGLKRKETAQFSFLLSIPAVAGANLLQIVSIGTNNGVSIPLYFVGFLSSFVAGVSAIRIVLRFLLTSRFKVFGVYTLLVGVLILIFS